MNPFEYQGPVAPADLIDRGDELDALQRAAADRVNLRLAAPRRYGKSSLLDAHVGSMRSAGHHAARVDFYGVATVVDVAGRLLRAYRSLPRDPGRLLERLSQRLGLTLGPAGATLTLGPDPAPRVEQAREVVAELLDLPARLHEADGSLTVVCFDEFQDLLTADDRLDGLFRSVIQHHARAAAYVFAGSEPSLMRALFAEYERPFYGQASPLELAELPVDEALADIGAAFEAAGLGDAVGDAVADVLGFTGGHPQRTILVAHHLFGALEDERGGDTPAAVAIDRSLGATRDAHQGAWDAMDRNTRLICLALADGEAPTGQRLAAQHRVARSSLSAALERLLTDGRHVRRNAAGHPYLVDPLFAEWLRRR